MTQLNYLGLLGQGIFAISSILLVMMAFIECHWKWWVAVVISILLFFISSGIAIN